MTSFVYDVASKISEALKDVPVNSSKSSGFFTLAEFMVDGCTYMMSVGAWKINHIDDCDQGPSIPRYSIVMNLYENDKPYIIRDTYTRSLDYEDLVDCLQLLVDDHGLDFVKPTIDGSVIENIVRQPSNSCADCRLCRIRKSHGSVMPMCLNDKSKNFGKILNQNSYRHWACKDFIGHTVSTASFEEALDDVLTPRHLFSHSVDHFVEPNSEKGDRPCVVFYFKSNCDLAAWRDAHMTISLKAMTTPNHKKKGKKG